MRNDSPEDDPVMLELMKLTLQVTEQRLQAKQAPDNDPELDEESSYDFEDNLVKLKEEKEWMLSARFSEEETVSNGVKISSRALSDAEMEQANSFPLRYKVYKRIDNQTFLKLDKSSGEKTIITSGGEVSDELKQRYLSPPRPKTPEAPLAITPIPVESVDAAAAVPRPRAVPGGVGELPVPTGGECRPPAHLQVAARRRVAG